MGLEEEIVFLYEGVKLGAPLLIYLFNQRGIKATFYYTGGFVREKRSNFGECTVIPDSLLRRDAGKRLTKS